MASKRFRDKQCIYCNEVPSTATGDHLIARAFFLVSDRDNLPKVPCCKNCNGEKSALEHYLSSVMLLGGRHEPNVEALKLSERRLEKNLKLKRELGSKSGIIHRAPFKDGEGRFGVPFDATKLVKYSRWVAVGLNWIHGGDKFSEIKTVDIKCVQITQHGDELLKNLIQSGDNILGENLGRGTFEYSGVVFSDGSNYCSIWRFSFLGGFRTTDRASNDSEAIWALSGNNEMMSELKNFVDFKG